MSDYENEISSLLQEAASWRGYLEKATDKNLEDFEANAGSGNYTYFWKVLKPSFQGQPWCQCFVNFCFQRVFGIDTAKKLLYTPGDWSYYTPTAAGYFKSNKAYGPTPHVGDLIFFKNSVRIHHIGIVYKVTEKYIYTYEGNTSNDKEVIPNGGEVCAKRYERSRIGGDIDGFGTPNWKAIDSKPVTDKYTIGWHQDEKGWWYAKSTKAYARNQWLVINGCKYYFNNEGYAVTGLQEINGKRYFFENTPGAPKECALMTTDQVTPDPSSIGSLHIAYF